MHTAASRFSFRAQSASDRNGVAVVTATSLLVLWMGGPSITKTMKIPQRHGAGFDPPIFFCASPIQNTPGGSAILQDDFRTKLENLPPKRVFEAL
jgi:hypothetical protein